jgi:SET domain-containing protein
MFDIPGSAMPSTTPRAPRQPSLSADRAAPVEVRASKINGRGLFAGARLPGRRKLGEISGKLVRLPAAWKQVEKSDKIYLIELNPRQALECSTGNSFRYLNHSCAANCYMRIIRNRVEIYTRIPIKAGAELTVNYGATPHKGGMRCACGAPKCKGRL